MMNAVKKIGHPEKNARLHAAFGDRLNTAMDNNPNCPPKNHGQLEWLAGELMKRTGIQVTRASVSRWVRGDAMPTPDKLAAISEALSVDVSWLGHGVTESSSVTPRERRAHHALASGIVNVVAGIIQMDGGTIAFPDDRDPDAVHLHVIIKGARYAFHVAMAERDGDMVRMRLPKSDAAIMIAVVKHKGFDFDLFEVPSDVIETYGQFGRGMVEVIADEGDLRRIESFAERL